MRGSSRESLLERVVPAEADLVPEIEGEYTNILVPLKLGPIGEEVLATAVRLAEERASKVSVLYVLRVPLDRPLDAEMPEEEQRAAESLAEIAELAAEHKLDDRRDDRPRPRARRGDRRSRRRSRAPT